MGLFDTVDCKYSLPKPENPQGYEKSFSFQTKDLNNSLSLYQIREDGTLWIEKCDGFFKEGNPKGKNLSEKLGQFVLKKTWFEQVFHHGVIEIYDYLESNSKDFDYFISYEIQFDRGVITSVQLLEFTAKDNSRRKILHKKNKEEMRIAYEFRQTKKYKYFYGPYNRLVRKIFKNINNIAVKIPSILYKIENKLIL